MSAGEKQLELISSTLPMDAVLADDFYDRLSIPRTASQDEVKRAYLKNVRRYPPERAPEEFKRIREAYETLSNPHTREEYDNRLDPVVDAWLKSALQSMRSNNYAVAEGYLKRVLIQLPKLDFVRNMLGLCYLYQEQPEKAVAQYEKLLNAPEADAVWLGNCAAAYRMLKRFADAERTLLHAIQRSDEIAVDYYVALADVYLDQEAFEKAIAILKRGIAADAQVDFEDLRFFTKLLEVHIRRRDLAALQAEAEGLCKIPSHDDERAFVAWKLGSLGQTLVAAQGFNYAIHLTHAARILQPLDHDYYALDIATRQLAANELRGAMELVKSHPSFGPEGWLHRLRPEIEQYCQKYRIFTEMRSIERAPTLFTFNTIGTYLYGQRDYDAETRSYVATLYFGVLFLPLIPLACFRVIPQGDNRWAFLGKVPFSQGNKLHLWLSLGLLFLFFLLVSAQG
jgi:curved DNA-binding protein CbpA